MKQVDKNFRDKLGHYESDVPTNMWDRIAPALEKETKRTRPIFWLSFLGGLMFVAMVGGFYTLSNNTSDTTSQDSQMSANEFVIPLAASENKINEYTSDLASITESKNILNEYGNSTDSNISKGISGSMNADDSLLKSDVSSKKDLNATNSSRTNLANSFSNQVRHTNQTSTSNSGTEVSLVITKSYFDGSEKRSDVNTKLKFGKNSRSIISLSKLSDLDYKLNTTTNRLDGFDIGIFGSKAPQCPSFIDKRVGFFLDGYVSHNLANNHLSGDSEYVDIRNETELAQYSFGAGVRASYFLGKGFGLRSGIAFNQINTQLAFDDPSAWRIRITTQTIIEIDSEGNKVEIEREVEEVVQGRSIITHNNKYRFLDIPVLAFYEFGSRKSPFYFSVNAGVNINLLFSQEGRYVNTSNTVSSYKGDDENPNPYKTNAGLSLYSSFGIHYVFNDNIDIMVEPHFSTQLSPLTNSNSFINQRFSTFGLNTGIRYKF